MMRFFELARLLGIAKNGQTRLKRLLLFAFLSLVLLIGSSIVSGFLIQSELNSFYSQNYNTLKAAGFSDVITSPEIVKERVRFLLILVPLIGIGFTLPLYCFAVSEICKLDKDLKRIIKHQKASSIEEDNETG